MEVIIFREILKLSIKFDVVDIKIIILMAVIPSTHTKRPSLELKLPAVLPLYKKPYNTAVVNMIAQMPNKEPPNMLQIGRNQMAELINKSKESAE